MAQDLTKKRLNLASSAVDNVTALVNAVYALQQLQDEFADVGAYSDNDFLQTDLTHLTAALMNAVFGGGGTVANLLTFYAANKQNLLSMLR